MAKTTKIAIEHKHSKVFKIFRRNTTPTDRIEALLELDPFDVDACLVDLIGLYDEVAIAYKNEDALSPRRLNALLGTDL